MSKKTYALIVIAALAVIFVGCRIISEVWLNAVIPEETKVKESGRDRLPPDVRRALEGLDTDYSKIRWGIEYVLSDDYPGVVVGVAPYYTDPYHYLAVAVTNVHPVDIVFSGDFHAKSEGGEDVGSGFFFKEHIGSGCTIMIPVSCGTDEAPDGRLSWTNIQIETADKSAGTSWTSDWEISKDPLFKRAGADLRIRGTGIRNPDIKNVSAFLLDDKGNILSGAQQYIHDKPLIGDYRVELDFYIDEKAQERIDDMAVFICTN